MHLLNYLNNHPNWQTELKQAPYYYDIKQDGDYYLLKYNLFLSDFNDPMTLEARGCIFRQEGDKWICVCRALDKFGNYGESYAATSLINWSRGVDVQEKIDGSIIKVWYDRDKWHISTNGCIDAFKVSLATTTFGDKFLSLLNGSIALLDSSYVYYFELVSPLNRIVINYDTEGIYFLGARNIMTLQESSVPPLPFSSVKYPRHYTYHSLAECVAAAKQMGVDEEGYVVVSSDMMNGSFLRIKVKGDEYLRLHHLRGNGPLTVRRILTMWKEDSLDDYLGAFPEDHVLTDEVMAAIKQLVEGMEKCYTSINLNDTRANMAHFLLAYEPTYRAYCFSRLDHKIDNAINFLKRLRVQSFESTLSNYMDITKIISREDEE